MKIINQTRNAALAEKAAAADTFFKRIIGLLGRKDFCPGEAIILTPCNSIHTFFMRFPIDVLFLKKDYTVLKAVFCLKPFRITAVSLGASSVIELPAGTLRPTNTQPGDKISIID